MVMDRGSTTATPRGGWRRIAVGASGFARLAAWGMLGALSACSSWVQPVPIPSDQGYFARGGVIGRSTTAGAPAGQPASGAQAERRTSEEPARCRIRTRADRDPACFADELGIEMDVQETRRRLLMTQASEAVNLQSLYNTMVYPFGAVAVYEKLRGAPNHKLLLPAVAGTAIYAMLNARIPDSDKLYLQTSAELQCSLMWHGQWLYLDQEINDTSAPAASSVTSLGLPDGNGSVASRSVAGASPASLASPATPATPASPAIAAKAANASSAASAASAASAVSAAGAAKSVGAPIATADARGLTTTSSTVVTETLTQTTTPPTLETGAMGAGTTTRRTSVTTQRFESVKATRTSGDRATSRTAASDRKLASVCDPDQEVPAPASGAPNLTRDLLALETALTHFRRERACLRLSGKAGSPGAPGALERVKTGGGSAGKDTRALLAQRLEQQSATASLTLIQLRALRDDIAAAGQQLSADGDIIMATLQERIGSKLPALVSPQQVARDMLTANQSLAKAQAGDGSASVMEPVMRDDALQGLDAASLNQVEALSRGAGTHLHAAWTRAQSWLDRQQRRQTQVLAAAQRMPCAPSTEGLMGEGRKPVPVKSGSTSGTNATTTSTATATGSGSGSGAGDSSAATTVADSGASSGGVKTAPLPRASN